MCPWPCRHGVHGRPGHGAHLPLSHDANRMLFSASHPSWPRPTCLMSSMQIPSFPMPSVQLLAFRPLRVPHGPVTERKPCPAGPDSDRGEQDARQIQKRKTRGSAEQGKEAAQQRGVPNRSMKQRVQKDNRHGMTATSAPSAQYDEQRRTVSVALPATQQRTGAAHQSGHHDSQSIAAFRALRQSGHHGSHDSTTAATQDKRRGAGYPCGDFAVRVNDFLTGGAQAPVVRKCFSAGGLLTTTQVVGNKSSVSV